jgi:hypothetical protein
MQAMWGLSPDAVSALSPSSRVAMFAGSNLGPPRLVVSPVQHAAIASAAPLLAVPSVSVVSTVVSTRAHGLTTFDTTSYGKVSSPPSPPPPPPHVTVPVSLSVAELTAITGTLFWNDLGLDPIHVTDLAQSLKLPTSAITALRMAGNRLGGTGTLSLCRGLKANSRVHTLDLSRNHVDVTGAVACAKLLKLNATLHTLDLNENAIGDKGAYALGDSLKSNVSLTELQLESNGIGQAGIIDLGAALKRPTIVLRVLNLQSNHIGAIGAAVLAEALKVATCPLVELNLQRNNIRDDGATSLAEALKV